MKIALLGYGKMGKAIEQIAVERGHEVVLKIDKDSAPYNIEEAEVAIEFSTPATAFANITNCITHQVPVVAGTTGWLSDYDKAVELCQQHHSALLYASNFSVGVNVFFALNKMLAKLMAPLKDYDVAIEEIHHTQKLDAPSGTAITLAEGIIAHSDKVGWKLGNAPKDEIPIEAKRIGDVAGIHSITYRSEVDTIEIKHSAHSRKGFAIGAVMAAEWIAGKKGIFTMNDVLGI
ncbi:dihydrodipicolinate reductase [Capnocytophaga haemolytica]|uniref:4-hydroxy-tetrahydrodipicolinate reductase n=1 Tax=Capnocytophaga haemolytica TaxID=45243 RepID=A0AAX2H3J0_9FLAO|nr:4-hydroxy-tetrahydrodipicolinate reductase [Capnocytophaga haemolytica]AMD85677.1 4-hydroxy-tetrahydrodipicolinate reductase [Capnocytophaga haemolytica]SFN90513.1 dihydrodipicolinate reductase [Capnocytophaga haemolytica]SNV16441.1 Dihydrodipicolinate reductase [Capnocytophaga haemolytica]